jgi:hypothetical protein
MYPNDTVSLKWRVWLGICLIVFFFSNVNSYNLRPQIHELRESVTQLEQKIGFLEDELEGQIHTIEALRQDVQKAIPAKEATRQ